MIDICITSVNILDKDNTIQSEFNVTSEHVDHVLEKHDVDSLNESVIFEKELLKLIKTYSGMIPSSDILVNIIVIHDLQAIWKKALTDRMEKGVGIIPVDDLIELLPYVRDTIEEEDLDMIINFVTSNFILGKYRKETIEYRSRL